MGDGIDLERLAPVFETIGRVKAALPAEMALLGFCGAPWTVATYMIAGRGTPDQAPARLMAYREPEAFAALIDRLVQASTGYLCAQIEAGVDAVQIFDSWAGILPADEFDRWVTGPIARIVAGVRRRHPGARIIGFPRGAGTLYEAFAARRGGRRGRTRLDGRPGVGAPPHPGAQAGAGQSRSARCCSPAARRSTAAIEAILPSFADGPLIFNLGHGILPQTPIAHVERMIARVRRA